MLPLAQIEGRGGPFSDCLSQLVFYTLSQVVFYHYKNAETAQAKNMNAPPSTSSNVIAQPGDLLSKVHCSCMAASHGGPSADSVLDSSSPGPLGSDLSTAFLYP